MCEIEVYCINIASAWESVDYSIAMQTASCISGSTVLSVKKFGYCFCQFVGRQGPVRGS